MKIKVLLMAAVLAGLLFSLSASAVITNPSCGIVPFDSQLSYVNATEIDKFDQSLGCLKSVRLTAQACGHLTAEVDSEDETAQEFSITALARVIPNLPNVGEEIFQIGLNETFNLSADDEPGANNANFAGPDYSGLLTFGSQTVPECTDERVYIFTGAQMDPFKGNPGDKLQIPVRTQSAITVIGSVLQQSRSSAFMGIRVCVVYEYEPLCINGSKIDGCTDEGLAGWTINLLDANGNVIDSETTGSDGSYSFCGLIPGTYSVEEVLQAGWQAVSGPTNPIVLDCNEGNSENNDFLNTQLLCINGSKIDDCTDEGLAGWTINLLDADGNVIDTETTGSDGSYSFCGLIPGTYSVEEVLQAGWQAVSGPTNPIVLDCNEGNSENNDFLNTQPLCINGTKINSMDGTGLAGWEICLTKPDGTSVCTTTDANGEYSFCNLASGTYTVCETPQNGWTPVGDTCLTVLLECEDSPDNDFENQPEAQEVCETAWAFLDDWKCFAKTGNWGSLTEITPGETLTLTGDVWAGRAKCDQTKGWKVGTATITVSADGYELDFDLFDDCHVEDLHVWVNNEKPVVKGGFSDKRWYKSEFMDDLDLDLTKPIWVAVHTETCCSACDNGCTYPAPK